ncbi:MAG: DnaD domain protein [Bacillota bacterium]|nr:DnaD domain protein [Bacillota bacterium]
MNYLKEINAFMDWLEINPLEATTQALWFHIMAISNKCGWPEWFTVANLTLQAKIGITDKTLGKHRNLLIQKGRIDYRNQGKQKAGKYKIIPFSGNIPLNHSVNPSVNYPVNPSVKCSTLFKLNETKQFKEEVEEAQAQVVATLETEFGRMPSPAEIEKLDYFISQGMDKLVVCEAIKRSRLNGVLKVSYAEGILKSWLSSGVTDLAAIQRHDIEIQQAKEIKNKIRSANVKHSKTNVSKALTDKYKDIYMG